MIRWINGELSFNQIKKINIEELLERDEIKLDEQRIGEEIGGKTILVTGAAGSIGSEIVRQISRFAPRQLILIDQAETPLHYLELETLEYNKGSGLELILCDICNELRMRKIFDAFHPDMVYHAAAYKHVPMMESNPAEAVLTNVGGTQIVADLSVEYGVKKFIMISTDKAVNPTNVMGASKRIAEIYTQALTRSGNTRFITTRFGNVLGSNGSVIPLFRSQIEKGGPLTITHPEVTRFFMTIPEACQLVLEAGAHGKGGEIFIFDMGKSVRILDLAKKMIQLSGLTLGKDIQIKYTGLRPGEKLYEELLNIEENTIPTHHPLILTAKVRELSLPEVRKDIADLISLVSSHANFDIIRKMKQMVPEYKSQNSVYEELDK
jgi:FlaA1/EpsC-like NDP-sugar epimerase